MFVACLPFSDYSFAMAVDSQQIEDFVHALTCCLTALGGVPKALVPDILKSAIIKANRYEPDVNRALEDLANHYNTTLVPTRIASPKDKALISRLATGCGKSRALILDDFGLTPLSQQHCLDLMELGYSEVSTYTKAFKRIHDISPGKWRNLNLDQT